jgi:hypothetical protein
VPVTLLKDSSMQLPLGPGLDGGPPRERSKVFVGQRDADGMNQPPGGHSQDAKQDQAQERRKRSAMVVKQCAYEPPVSAELT